MSWPTITTSSRPCGCCRMMARASRSPFRTTQRIFTFGRRRRQIGRAEADAHGQRRAGGGGRPSGLTSVSHSCWQPGHLTVRWMRSGRLARVAARTGHRSSAHTRDNRELSPSRMGWGDSFHRPRNQLDCKNETAWRWEKWRRGVLKTIATEVKRRCRRGLPGALGVSEHQDGQPSAPQPPGADFSNPPGGGRSVAFDRSGQTRDGVVRRLHLQQGVVLKHRVDGVVPIVNPGVRLGSLGTSAERALDRAGRLAICQNKDCWSRLRRRAQVNRDLPTGDEGRFENDRNVITSLPPSNVNVAVPKTCPSSLPFAVGMVRAAVKVCAAAAV